MKPLHFALELTLGYSRWSFVWFTTDERFETLIDAHERFFDAIGGVPHTILYDSKAGQQSIQ